MKPADKKKVAALAAITLYLEAEAAMLLEAADNTPSTPPSPPNSWAEAGRLDHMTGRRLMQMRAFSTMR